MRLIDSEEPEKRKRRKRKKNRFTKPEFEVNELGLNNFVNKGFQIPFVRMRTKAFTEERNKNGELEKVRYRPDAEYLPFVKVFVLEKSREEVCALSLRGKELLLYIIYNLGTSNDFIAIDRKLYMQLHEIKTEPTYLHAVKELTKNGFIAQTADVRDVFWINPFYFFNGNRLTKFKDNKIPLDELLDKQDAEDLITEKEIEQ